MSLWLAIRKHEKKPWKFIFNASLNMDDSQILEHNWVGLASLNVRLRSECEAEV